MFGDLLTDLSNALGCLPYDPTIAKLNEYGFSLSASKFILHYLEGKEHK